MLKVYSFKYTVYSKFGNNQRSQRAWWKMGRSILMMHLLLVFLLQVRFILSILQHIYSIAYIFDKVIQCCEKKILLEVFTDADINSNIHVYEVCSKRVTLCKGGNSLPTQIFKIGSLRLHTLNSGTFLEALAIQQCCYVLHCVFLALELWPFQNYI